MEQARFVASNGLVDDLWLEIAYRVSSVPLGEDGNMQETSVYHLARTCKRFLWIIQTELETNKKRSMACPQQLLAFPSRFEVSPWDPNALADYCAAHTRLRLTVLCPPRSDSPYFPDSCAIGIAECCRRGLGTWRLDARVHWSVEVKVTCIDKDLSKHPHVPFHLRREGESQEGIRIALSDTIGICHSTGPVDWVMVHWERTPGGFQKYPFELKIARRPDGTRFLTIERCAYWQMLFEPLVSRD